jgi:hypothetical protein
VCRFLAALSRTFLPPQPPANGILLVGTLPAAGWDGVFTLGSIPPEGTVVRHLTISCGLSNDPARIEAMCRVCRIRFAEQTEPAPPEDAHGKLDGKIHLKIGIR